MKAVKYVLVYLIAIQLFLPYAFPLSSVYHNRMDYQLMLNHNNMHDIDAVLQQVKRDIDRRGLTDYVIVLGDSVFYGSPGNSDQVFTVFMEQKPGAPVFYNLSFPAMQLGDLYTMLLKLDKFGISSDKLMLNIRYASFIPRNPNPSAVFWLGNDLRKLDPEAYAYIVPQLESNGFKTPKNPYETFQRALHEDWLPQLQLMRYKDYIQKNAKNWALQLRGRPIPDDALDDSRPWFVKKLERGPEYEAYLQDEFLIASFTDKPFDLTENSPDVVFLNKIMERQKGKKTWIVLSGTNHDLMVGYVKEPGYAANLKSIEQMMGRMMEQHKGVSYINLEGVIPGELFTDHTHLTPEGNAKLADVLWPFMQR